MFDWDSLLKIADYKSKSDVLSLYLNTNREKDPKEGFKITFKDLTKSLPKNQKDNISKIEKYLFSQFSGEAKGLAFFSDTASGFWQVYELQVAVPNLVFVEESPYIKPLASILEDFQKFCVVFSKIS